MDSLCQHQKLELLFPDCPFMAATVNLGPRTECKMHRDFQNLVFGLCCIIVLGSFDYTKGGFLCLQEPNIHMEVAPGDIVFIPSACVTYGNTAIQPGEKRYSFTLYTAGQLFHWVKNSFAKKIKPRSKLVEKTEGDVRWLEGWGLHCTLDELK